ncbi:hypothetical protein PS874_06301 [Pseudomonas fluorescens]|nr:hypothetical protein PS874_06301 [Pseudomonas fluorescens]
MFDRIIQLLVLGVATATLIVTLLPPPAPTLAPAPLYAEISIPATAFRWNSS